MALHVMDEANQCLGCKKPRCQQGCPIQTNIPEVIRLLKANKLDEAGRKAGIVRVALRIGDKGALFRSAQLKFVFAAADQPIVPHFAQLLGKCAAVQVQVVRQLLAVKRDGKMRAARPHCLRGKIGQQPPTRTFWCGAPDALGERQVFLHRKQ